MEQFLGGKVVSANVSVVYFFKLEATEECQVNKRHKTFQGMLTERTGEGAEVFA